MAPPFHSIVRATRFIRLLGAGALVCSGVAIVLVAKGEVVAVDRWLGIALLLGGAGLLAAALLYLSIRRRGAKQDPS